MVPPEVRIGRPAVVSSIDPGPSAKKSTVTLPESVVDSFVVSLPAGRSSSSTVVPTADTNVGTSSVTVTVTVAVLVSPSPSVIV